MPIAAAVLLSLAACKDSGGEEPQGDGDGTGADTAVNMDGPADTGAAASSGGEDANTESGDGVAPLYDVGTIPDAPQSKCGDGGPGGAVEFSYIWIANSQQGTISKINTVSMEEEGRYYAKPAGGDPSRTSVSISGNVVVANRNGGLAKFYANPADCVESNGTPGIQTSSGGADILPWGEDECLAWYTDFTCSSNRPAAWTRGTWDESSCSFYDEKVWTACDDIALQLNGDTGEVEHAIKLSPGAGGGDGGGEFGEEGFPGGWEYHFVYGGAADADGNFWGLDTGASNMFRIDAQDYALTTYPLPSMGGYGITVDSVGRPWLCGGGSAARFNLEDSTWTESNQGWGGIGGCMTDGENRIWHSAGEQNGLVYAFDTDTLDIVEQISMPEYVHGISVDFQGNVWGVSFAGSNAYRGDPATGTVDTFSALVGAYTYSDMTGVGLSVAGGGGTPAG